MSEGRGESGLDRRKFIIGGLMAACAGVTFARLPRNRIDYLGSGKLEKLIPKKVGSWEFLTNSGLVVPPEDPLSDALYSQLLTRVYSNGTDPAIMLLIAQSAGQTGLLQVHRPESCYPVGGYELSPIVQQPIAASPGRTIDVNRLTASAPGRTEQLLYWTRVGDDMPISWARQRLSIAQANLRGDVPDAVLVRFSTIDPDPNGAFVRLSLFVENLMTLLGPAGRRVLISPA